MQDRKGMINFTNHPTKNWSDKQHMAAFELADEIVDGRFQIVNVKLVEDATKNDRKLNEYTTRVSISGSKRTARVFGLTEPLKKGKEIRMRINNDNGSCGNYMKD